MPFLVPTTQDASASLTVTLSDTIYNIRTRWNERNESWYIAISLADGTPIINFEKLSTHQSIVNYNRELFPGQLFLIPEEEERAPLGRDNFGQSYTYKLWYFDEIDLDILDEYNLSVAGGYFV